MVNQGHNYIGDVIDDDLRQIINNKKLTATTDYSFINDVDAVTICVPTPLDQYQQPDTSYVESSTKEIAKHLETGNAKQVLEDSYSGTTEDRQAHFGIVRFKM